MCISLPCDAAFYAVQSLYVSWRLTYNNTFFYVCQDFFLFFCTFFDFLPKSPFSQENKGLGGRSRQDVLLSILIIISKAASICNMQLAALVYPYVPILYMIYITNRRAPYSILST